MQKKFKILKPQYFDAFCCIGASCENSCCRREWRINVDKKTYNRLQALPDARWRQKLSQTVVVNNSHKAQEDDYAQIKLGSDGCPFLDKENYCVIERELGKDYPPLVCQTYPRIYNIINGMPEKSLALSCPEAARIVLSSPEPIQFAESEEDFYIFNIISNILDTANTDIPGEPQRYFWELRIFIIALLQNRHYALWERLAILGSFFDGLKDLGKTSTPAFIDKYSRRVAEQDFTYFLANVPNQIIIEVALIKKMLTMSGYSFSPPFAERRAEALWTFGGADKLVLEEVEISLRYAKAYYGYYRPLLASNGHILENYLVNYVFTSLFPFNEDKNIFDNYIYLAIHYSLIKILLVGTAGFYREKFNTGHIIKLLSAFAHEFEQDSSQLGEIFKFLNDAKLTGLENIMALLKN